MCIGIRRLVIAAALIASLLTLASCRREGAEPAAVTETQTAAAEPQPYAPIDRLEPMKIPPDNPMTEAKAQLGHQLWFEKRLSGDGQFSCYSCHLNEHGLTYGTPLGTGPFGKKLPRNSPTMWNVGYHTEWYWDGRAKTLEAQALAAWKGVNMGAEPDKIVATLNSIAGYREQFQKVFNQDATADNVAKTLATYMRTIISKETAWDRFQRGDQAAVSAEAQQGYQVFLKAKCENCHSGFLFSDLQYHNVGIGMKTKQPDVGRFTVTKNERDTGAFKTPTLRDIGDSGPYFHDGSVATLEEAVRMMVNGGIENPYLDRANLVKANLSAAEFRALMAFLRSLDEPTELEEPRLP
jgi:cytochrome c peroxidase